MLSPASSIHRGPNMLSDPLLVTETPGATKSLASAGARRPDQNPFKLPDDNNIFLLRNREQERRKMELQRQLGLRVHEKETYAGRMKAKQADLRRTLREGLLEEDEEEQERPGGQERPGDVSAQLSSPAWRTAMLKDRNIDKESMREFIAKKREMFLLEFSLAVKRGEMDQMEKAASAQERKLVRAERFLEEDAKLFDAFLKENDRDSVEAIKTAEQETKIKLDKMAVIKRTTAKMVAIKSDISKFEDTLKEYTLYKDFLFKLSPPDWQAGQRAKDTSATKTSDKDKERDKRTGRNVESRASPAGRALPPLRDPRASSSRQSRKSMNPSLKTSPVPETDPEPEEKYEVAPELYFTDPRQLMDLLTELEEQNLSLIQNSRETEEALEEFRKVMDHTHKKMEQETDQLTHQMDIMTQTIQRERERAAELELRARLFNYGKYKSDDGDGVLDSLGRKVDEVYRACVGDSEANLSTLQMLTAIEGRLGELLENMEMIPRDRLQLAEKTKEKERRLRLRDEKLREQKQHQEERLRRALERSQADIKRTTGKKLMTRSQPPARKQKTSTAHDITDKEKEEQLYFFT